MKQLCIAIFVATISLLGITSMTAFRDDSALSFYDYGDAFGERKEGDYIVTASGVIFSGLDVSGDPVQVAIGANTSGFVIINHDYAKDADNVYLNGKVISGADANSFQLTVPELGLGKDKSHTYIREKIQPIDFTNLLFDGTYSCYAKDKTQIYNILLNSQNKMTENPAGEEQNIDRESFHVLSECGYSQDKNNIYHRVLNGEKAGHEAIIENADKPTFKALNNRYAKDKNHVYFGPSIIQGADKKSFTTLGHDTVTTSYAKDKNHVYLGTFLAPAIVLSGADVKSFQVLGNGYARDKDNIYYYRDKLTKKEVRAYYESIKKNQLEISAKDTATSGNKNSLLCVLDGYSHGSEIEKVIIKDDYLVYYVDYSDSNTPKKQQSDPIISPTFSTKNIRHHGCTYFSNDMEVMFFHHQGSDGFQKVNANPQKITYLVGVANDHNAIEGYRAHDGEYLFVDGKRFLRTKTATGINIGNRVLIKTDKYTFDSSKAKIISASLNFAIVPSTGSEYTIITQEGTEQCTIDFDYGDMSSKHCPSDKTERKPVKYLYQHSYVDSKEIMQYQKKKGSVFFKNKKVIGADYATFTTGFNDYEISLYTRLGYTRDKSRVYYQGVMIPNSDPDSFMYCYRDDTIIDKSNIYRDGKIVGPASLSFCKDKNNVTPRSFRKDYRPNLRALYASDAAG